MAKYPALPIGIVFSILCLTSPVMATDIKYQSGITGFAKGFAVTADLTDPENVVKNPAAIGNSVKTTTVQTGYSSYFDGQVNASSVAMMAPLTPFLNASVRVPLTFVRDIPETVESNGKGVQVGTFSDLETAAIVTLGGQLTPLLNWGVNGTYYYHHLGSESATAVGLDAGVILDLGVKLGLAAENIGGAVKTWSTGHTDKLPATYHAGVTIPVHTVSLLADVTFANGQEWQANGGISVALIPQLTLHGGIQNALSAPRLHAGVSLDLKKMALQFAFSHHDILGNIYKFGISLN